MKQNKTAVPNIPDTPRSGVQVMACQSVGLTSRYQIYFKSSKTTNTMFSNINLSGIKYDVHFVISLYLSPKQNHIKNRRILHCASVEVHFPCILDHETRRSNILLSLCNFFQISPLFLLMKRHGDQRIILLYCHTLAQSDI